MGLKSLVIALFIFSFHSTGVYAWSEKAHILIAETAFQGLPAGQQAALNETAKRLLKKNSSHYRYYTKRYRDFSDFAYIAAWPDKIRKKNLKTLFDRHGASYPSQLAGYKSRYTSDWHYYNVPYPNHWIAKMRFCEISSPGRMFDVMAELNEALNQTKKEQRTSSSNQTSMKEALLLSFYVHMLSDAHQPLHILSGVDAYCRHDRGGNEVCLQKKGSKCALNLHQYWDRGAGIFDDADSFSENEKSPSPQMNSSELKAELIDEARALAPLVYPASTNVNDDIYRKNVQQASIDAAQRASHRLTQFLLHYGK